MGVATGVAVGQGGQKWFGLRDLTRSTRKGAGLEMVGLHLLEIFAKPCAFVGDVVEGTLKHLEEGVRCGQNNKKIIYGFKVVGENRLVAVFEGAVELALSQLNSVYGDHIEVTCTPLRSYETFAYEVLGLEKSLTTPSSRRLTSSLEGHLFWLTFKIGYCGLSATDLVSIWSKEATALLTLRNRGELELDLFKVVGQREVHLFVRAPNSDIMDDIIFTLPIMKEIGNQVQVRTKTIRLLTK